MHILIIEDEEQLCRSMAEGLRMDGYETDTCFDGEEGLELCMTENYDLILLDLNLPGIDGLEILRQFRTFNTNTPVLILSARVQIQDKVEGLDLGANDYINKFRMEKAIQLISTTDLTFTEIAEKIGFTTSRYFSTSFKQYTGETPTQYKEKIRKSSKV